MVISMKMSHAARPEEVPLHKLLSEKGDTFFHTISKARKLLKSIVFFL